MKTKQKISIAIVLVLGLMLWNAFTQEGVDDLSTEFQEVAFYRNENNTGPVKRVYVVKVSDTVWQDLEAYGNFQPHNKLGTTEVFFFADNVTYPRELSPKRPYFSENFNAFVLAKYEKSASGLTSLKKYPFK